MEEEAEKPKRSVLLVDDSPTWGRFVTLTLNAAGYDVRTTPDVSVTELVAEMKPDLILVDAHLNAELTGAELIRRLNGMEGRQAMKLYLFSAADESDLAEMAEECCADGYILKGVGPAAFAEIVGEALSA